MPGSHVIIKADYPDIDDETLLYAGKLAAQNSNYKMSPKALIDHTNKRYVKKPNGSKPGFVIYTNESSMLIDID